MLHIIRSQAVKYFWENTKIRSCSEGLFCFNVGFEQRLGQNSFNNYDLFLPIDKFRTKIYSKRWN